MESLAGALSGMAAVIFWTSASDTPDAVPYSNKTVLTRTASIARRFIVVSLCS
jgi:hypothetical protein